MTLSKKFVLTHTTTEYTKNAEILIVYENDKAIEASIIYDDEETDLNNIYVGHVKDIVKNIDCAFVEYDHGKIGYLSLKDAANTIFINPKNTNKICEGDNIIVQLIKEPIKTKYGVLSTTISFPGKYIVFESGKGKVHLSSKIKDNDFKDNISNVLKPLTDNCSLIVRTDAINVPLETIYDEACYLSNLYHDIITKGQYRTAYSILYKSIDANLNLIKDLYLPGDEIITDSEEIKHNSINILSQYFSNINIRLYDDKLLPLYKLYSVESVFKEINNSHVWLKSGAYIIIEHTEAMTVIDVNTGKCDKGKTSKSTFYKINLEATKEILRQIRLRNISGIILCDFINMESDEDDYNLLFELRRLAFLDRLKVNILGMTKLKLVEMTRKKVRERILLKKD